MEIIEKLIKHLKRVDRNSLIKSSPDVTDQIDIAQPSIRKMLTKSILAVDMGTRLKNEARLTEAGFFTTKGELTTSKGTYVIA
jgi:hypothetical protein